MLLKLAVRNIKRSVRDYVIYFITLLFGVALFYTFNSVGSQQVLFDMEDVASPRIFESTQMIMGMFSGLIAGVLGFLVLYSNRFLIRRRKREFGTYEVLGMSPGHVARIMLYETIIIGLVSLVLGLGLGVLLSQGLSFLTGLMFGATIKNYQFVFSPEAFTGTLVCFAIIFLVVAVFNTVTVGRYRLITLLQAEQKNERAPVRNQWVCLVVFVVAVGILAFAYQQLIESGMETLDDPRFLRATVAMLVGSFLFFWSLSGFAIAVITRLRGVYLRGLRPFTVRQIASKVNTAFFSLWAVCVLLFFSITTFSTGMGLVDVFVGGVEKANPYSATLRADVWYDDLRASVRPDSTELNQRAQAMEEAEPAIYAEGAAVGWNMAAPLQAASPELWQKTVRAYAQVDNYEVPGLPLRAVVEQVPDEAWRERILNDGLIGRAMDQNMQILALSQFNATRALQGQPPVELADSQCVFNNNMGATQELSEGVARSGLTLDVNGFALTVQPDLYDTQLDDNGMLSAVFVMVAPDAVVDSLKAGGAIPFYSYLNLMYADNGLSAAQNDDSLARIVAAVQPPGTGAFENATAWANSSVEYARTYWPVTMVITANDMINQSSGLRMLITYLAVYIGLVFLLSTAAILAVQQLSETVDSQNRYRMLWRLGCDSRMINRSLLAQVLVYFLVPLGLAACHAACAIYVLSDSMFRALATPVFAPIMMAAAFTAVIYGGYLVITYLASRSILRPMLRAS